MTHNYRKWVRNNPRLIADLMPTLVTGEMLLKHEANPGALGEYLIKEMYKIYILESAVIDYYGGSGDGN